MDKQLTPTLINYLDRIAGILDFSPVARMRDIAFSCGVTVSSAITAMSRLDRLGYVHYEVGSYVLLTEQGKEEAKRFKDRRKILEKLFSVSIKMDSELSKTEARIVAPYFSDAAVRSISIFLEEKC